MLSCRYDFAFFYFWYYFAYSNFYSASLMLANNREMDVKEKFLCVDMDLIEPVVAKRRSIRVKSTAAMDQESQIHYK